MINMNSNGETEAGEYAGMIEAVFIDGDMTVTADFNDMAVYEPIE